MSGSIGDNVFRASGVIAAAAAGRTGAVDWQTGSIKTAGFTAATTEGYFCDTSGGVFTVALPVGIAGSIVAVSDYTRTFNTNNLTISPNGSEKIGGTAADATLDVNGQSATFVYVDGTEGWINTQETETSLTGSVPFLTTSGGTPSQCGDYEIKTFTGPGTFCVSAVTGCSSLDKVDWLVAAGGGAGGGEYGGGGGAGGYRESPGTSTGSYTVSPLGAAPAAAIEVTVQGYSIVTGAGAAGRPACTPGAPAMANGIPSSFSTYTSAGGGTGRWDNCAGKVGDGGSGGGGGGNSPCSPSQGLGNTPPTNPSQGSNGGEGQTAAPNYGRSGGGGALVVGANGTPTAGGNGGGGATSSINGTPTARAGGGGAGIYAGPATAGTGGSGGGGAGSPGAPVGVAGTVNTGGGGGGASYVSSVHSASGAGGSGVVILRYKFQ